MIIEIAGRLRAVNGEAFFGRLEPSSENCCQGDIAGLLLPAYSSLDEYVCSILRTYGVLQFHLLNIKGSVLS